MNSVDAWDCHYGPQEYEIYGGMKISRLLDKLRVFPVECGLAFLDSQKSYSRSLTMEMRNC